MAREMVTVFIYIAYFLQFLYISYANTLSESVPIVNSISVINETYIVNENSEKFFSLTAEMHGVNFYSGMKVRATTNPPEKGECSASKQSDSEHNFSELWSNSTVSLMTVLIKLNQDSNYNEKFYVCVGSGVESSDQSKFISTFPSEVIKWVHQGKDVVFRTASENSYRSSKQNFSVDQM